MQFDSYNHIELQQLIDNIPNEFYAVNLDNWTIERIEKDEMGWDFSTVNEMRVSGTSVEGTKRTCIYAVNGVELEIKFFDMFPNFDTYNLASLYTFNKWFKQLTPAQGKINLNNLDEYSIDFLKLKLDHPHLFV